MQRQKSVLLVVKIWLRVREYWLWGRKGDFFERRKKVFRNFVASSLLFARTANKKNLTYFPCSVSSTSKLHQMQLQRSLGSKLLSSVSNCCALDTNAIFTFATLEVKRWTDLVDDVQQQVVRMFLILMVTPNSGDDFTSAKNYFLFSFEIIAGISRVRFCAEKYWECWNILSSCSWIKILHQRRWCQKPR